MPNLPISQLPLTTSGQPESWMAIVNYDVDPSGITNKIYFSSLTEQFSGSTGTSGTSGIDGSSGTSGIDGSSGTSGSSGTDGSSGTSGIDGSSGTSGIDGSSGTSGTDGSSGTSGTSGIDGSSGTSGTDGSSGTSGIDGSSGTSGIDGSSGTSGTDGSSGTSGSSGTDGSSGTSGTDGSSGTSGTDGSSGSSGTSGTSATGTTKSYGAFYDTETQPLAAANTPQVMSANTSSLSSGVVLSGGTKFVVLNSGIYNLQFSSQLNKTSSGTDEIAIWFRKNGVDLPNSNTEMQVPKQGSTGKLVAAWNILEQLNANEYLEIVWASADTTYELLGEPIQTTPYAKPATPSIIVTVTQV